MRAVRSIDRLFVWQANGTLTAAKDLGLSVPESDFLSDGDIGAHYYDYLGNTGQPPDMTRAYPVADDGQGRVIWRQETLAFGQIVPGNPRPPHHPQWDNDMTKVDFYLGNTTGPTSTTPLGNGVGWTGNYIGQY